VGGLGQRKGLSYLFDAMRQMGSAAELTLIGRKTTERCAPLNEALKVHRWIPSLPHREVLEEMAKHDVLVFPTLFEGFALVILEALSRGLPVITTENSGGGEIIHSGENGFIVPIRSSAALAGKLDLLANDRALLAGMKAAALRTAETCTWAAYRSRLAATVLSALPQPSFAS
jgi:glycosyltransferase involved in cell wall biosynthesis